LSGNPIGMAAGIASLDLCATPGFYEALGAATRRLADGLQGAADRAGIPARAASLGGMLGFSFTRAPLRNFTDAAAGDHARFARFFRAMLGRGVWLPPSSYEAMFVSAAHGPAEIDRVIAAAAESLQEIG
jgi:glutamate-1-semialdehyde 2,1-aminomutase